MQSAADEAASDRNSCQSPISQDLATAQDFATATVDEILQSFAHFGVELGLERIQRLLANLGNPHLRVPIIHVAGSNGKGSVCTYLASVLTEAGYRVGKYISPHLVDWCERISLNGQDIAPDQLRELVVQVRVAIDLDQPSPTQFEVITAAAWLYFAQQQVDVAVMEVGLGGRLDATNVCDRPLVSIITSLSLEHWQRLGPTLADIAREKAGILKPRCPAVIAPLPPEAEPVVKQRVAELSCLVRWVQPAQDLGEGRAMKAGLVYSLPLPGAHQLTNSAVAIAALRLLQHQDWNVSDEAIVSGIAKARWPGRLQWFEWEGHRLLIDGAHNPAAAQVLRQFVDSSAEVRHPVCWVMGMLTTKDHADVFKALLRGGDRLFLVPVPDHLSADPQDLARLAGEVCPELGDCRVYPDVVDGLRAAVAAGSEGTTVLCGSLYLIGSFFGKSEA